MLQLATLIREWRRLGLIANSGAFTMGKWASKHKRSSFRRSSQKSGRAYSAGQEEDDDRRKNLSPSGRRDHFGPNSTPFQNPDSVTCLESWGGRYCASGSSDGTILVQDIDKSAIISQKLGHTKEVTRIKRNENNYISASRDKTIKIWKISSPTEQGQLVGHTLSITGLDCDAQLSQIWSGSRDNFVKLWDVETETCTKESKISRNLVTDMCLSSELNVVAQTSEDRIVKLWDARNLEVFHSFPMQSQIQTSCSILHNFCVTTNNGFGSQGCEICLWDLRERRILQTLRGHTETVTDCQFSHTDLISCSHDGSVRLWRATENELYSNARLQSTIHLSSGSLNCVSILNERKLLCGSFDKGILIVNIQKNELSL